jgi:ribonuclease Y
LDELKLEFDQVQINFDQTKAQAKDLLIDKVSMDQEMILAELLGKIDQGLQYEAEMRVQKREEHTKEDSEKIARRIIMDSIQKYAKESSVEKKYATLHVPKDYLKGNIVGRNAKNLLFFEEKTGAQVIFNDTPNSIIISHYSLYKQEIAYMAMKKMITKNFLDTRLIEKILLDVEKEMDLILLKIGRNAAEKLDLHGYPDEFLRMIGRLKFRTSFGQNILSHSFEVAALGKMIAYEIGADPREAELACFFHDIGKAIDQDVNKPHDLLSKEILEEYKFPESIVYAAYAHHDAVPPKHVVDFLVKATDAISASRPGARQETLEKYLEKIRALESIAYDKPGVDKAYAISAGREVRVFVDAQKIDDLAAQGVARKIADEVEEKVAYPGKIKINLIRRTEAVDYANKKSK